MIRKKKGPPVPLHETGPKCDGCPFRSTSFGFVPGSGSIDSPILVLGEAAGRDETEKGRPFVGGSGRVLNALMIPNRVDRTSCYITNVVKCRPIDRWPNGEPKINPRSGDYFNATPPLEQQKECVKRYLVEELERFGGSTLVGVGGIPLRAIRGMPLSITQYAGSIFERGELIPCTPCSGIGLVPLPPKKCTVCKGVGTVVHFTPASQSGVGCTVHPEYEGKNERKKCQGCADVYRATHSKPRKCIECDGSGGVARGVRVCKTCKESGKVPKDPSNQRVSTLLKEGQLYLATYHPAYLMRSPGLFDDAKSHWRRVNDLHSEIRNFDEFDIQIYNSGEVIEFPKSRIQSLPGITVDLETKGGLDPLVSGTRITHVGMSTSPTAGRVVEFRSGDSLPSSHLRMVLQQSVIGHNYTLYDAWWTYHKWGITPKVIYDTRGLSHLTNPDSPNTLVAATQQLAEGFPGFWKTSENYRDRLGTVAGIDVCATTSVYLGGIKLLEERGQRQVFERNVVPLCSVVLDIRKHGIRVNEEEMEREGKRMDKDIERLRVSLPEGITENHSDKLKRLFFEELGHPQIFGGTSTDRRSLEQIVQRGYSKRTTELARTVMSLRKLSKLRSSFLSYKLQNGSRIHPILNPFGTATLRLSSSDPNIQQIPKGSRGIFLPDEEGQVLTAMDLSQAEVICFLYIAGEYETAKKIIQTRADIHQYVADLVGIDRTPAKIITFGLLYGQAPITTADNLGISIEEVMDLREKYFAALPAVKAYRSAMISHCEKMGYVESPFSVRRYIRCDSAVGRAANMACNAPIQNMPAMVTRYMMIKLYDELPEGARLWTQVHDEVVVNHWPHQTKEVVDCILEALAWSLKFGNVSDKHPLQIAPDFKQGVTWGDMKDLEVAA